MKSLLLGVLSLCVHLADGQLARPNLYYARGLQQNVSALATISEPENAVMAFAGREVVLMRLGDLKEFGNYKYSWALLSNKDISISEKYIAVSFKYQGREGVSIQNIQSGKAKDTFFFPKRKPVFFTLDATGAHLLVLSRLRKAYTISIYPTDSLQTSGKSLIVGDSSSTAPYQDIKSFSELTIKGKKYYLLFRYYQSQYEFAIADSAGTIIFESNPGISNLSVLNGDRVAFIEDETTLKILDFSKTVDSPTVAQEIDLGHTVDFNSFISPDGKYLIFKRHAQGESLVSAEIKIHSCLPGYRLSDQTRGSQTGFTYLYDISRKAIVDSVSIGDLPFCYSPAKETLVYPTNQHLFRNNPSGFVAHNIALKTNKIRPQAHLVGFADVAYNSQKKVLATLTSNGDVNLLYITTETKIKLLYNREPEDYQYSPNNKLFYSANNRYLLKTAGRRLKYWSCDSFRPVHYVPLPDSITDVYCTRSDSIIYLLSPLSLYKFNFITQQSVVIFNQVLFLSNGKLAISHIKIIDDTTAAVISDQQENGVIKQSLQIVSLKTGDTIARWSNTTKHFPPKDKAKSDGGFEVDQPAYLYPLITGLTKDTIGHFLNVYDDDFGAVAINYQTGKMGKKPSWVSIGIPTTDQYPLRILPEGVGIKDQTMYAYNTAYADYDSAFYFTADGGSELGLYSRKNDSAILKMTCYSDTAEKRFDNNWLFFAKEGYFDGNSNVVDNFFWNDSVENIHYSYDAFYNSFFTPNLLYRILKHSFKPTGLDISYYIKIPGLAGMIRNGNATVVRDPGRPYLCISRIAADNPILQSRTASGEISFARNSQDSCKVKIAIPPGLDLTVYGPGKPVAQPAKPWRPQERKGTLYVTFIGIGSYAEGSQLDSLPYTGRSVENVVKSLEKHQSALKKSFDSVAMYYLLDKNATLDNIYAHLNFLIASAKKDDCVLFYFNGHGIIPTGSQVFYFFPYDGVNGDIYDIQKTCLNSSSFAGLISYLNCDRIALVIDACQSGGSIESLDKMLEIKNNSSQGNAAVDIVTATLPIEYASQLKDGSLLSQDFLRSAEKLPQVNSSPISLLDYLEGVKKEAENDNKGGTIQNPIFIHSGTSYPFFSRN